MQIPLRLIYFKGSHSAEATAEATKELAKEFGIEVEDFYTITTDNESAEVAAINKSSVWSDTTLHIRCQPHSFQLPIKKALFKKRNGCGQ